MSHKKQKKCGFSYYFPPEKIAFWQTVPVEQKLQWLSEASQFLYMVMPKKNKKIVEKFRKGLL